MIGSVATERITGNFKDTLQSPELAGPVSRGAGPAAEILERLALPADHPVRGSGPSEGEGER